MLYETFNSIKESFGEDYFTSRLDKYSKEIEVSGQKDKLNKLTPLDF